MYGEYCVPANNVTADRVARREQLFAGRDNLVPRVFRLTKKPEDSGYEIGVGNNLRYNIHTKISAI